MKTIATEIEIDATPARVWQVLTDFPAHPDWNPFIKAISGSLGAGRTLTIRIQPPGGKGMTFRPTVLVADPERELRWKGKLLLPGIFDGEHVFRLEATGRGTRFYHAETFSGLLVALMGNGSFKAIEQGFTAMNQALKQRAEASSSS